MNLNKLLQKWWYKLAKYRCLKANEPLRDLPRVELIPVKESKEEFEKRVQEVREIIARMYLNTKKRGRPSNDQWEEDHAA